MIEAAQEYLLIALITPLILAMFVKRINHSLALLAALLLVITAIIANYNSTIVLPSAFFGLTFNLSDESVLLILMISIIWLINWYRFHRCGLSLSTLNSKVMRFNLLLLFSSICASLAADLVSFYCFSIIVSYSFYGLLVSQSNSLSVLRAARQCLILIIISDLILFDALLLANQALENSKPLATLKNNAKISEEFSLFVVVGLC